MHCQPWDMGFFVVAGHNKTPWIPQKPTICTLGKIAARHTLPAMGHGILYLGAGWPQYNPLDTPPSIWARHTAILKFIIDIQGSSRVLNSSKRKALRFANQFSSFKKSLEIENKEWKMVKFWIFSSKLDRAFIRHLRSENSPFYSG